MKRKIQLIVLVVFFIGIGVYSCKKSSNNSAQNMLQGTWAISSELVDTNCSGLLSLNYTDTSFAHTLLTFNTNGTFVASYYNSVTARGLYSLLDNSKFLKLEDTVYGGDTVSYQVEMLTSSAMRLLDTDLHLCNDEEINFTK